jgi:hypothetical protein
MDFNVADMETCTAEFQRLVSQVGGLVTAWALADAYRARVAGEVDLPEGVERDRFALACVVAYLVVAAGCWIAAMPSYLAARDGLTPGGDPIGWFPCSLTTAVLSLAIVAAAYLGRAPARTLGYELGAIDRNTAPA